MAPTRTYPSRRRRTEPCAEGHQLTARAQGSREGSTRHPRASTSPSDLEILRSLGEGTFGRVYMVRASRASDTNPLFAVKALGKAKVADTHNNVESADKHVERAILASLPPHPFLPTLYDAFNDTSNLYLLMNLAPHRTLHHLIWCTSDGRPRALSPAHARFYFSGLALALEHLHKHGIVHRDVKPGNVLIGGDGYPVLTDFGLATYVRVLDTQRRAPLNAPREPWERKHTLYDWTSGATPGYSAPECGNSQNFYGPAMDWFAAGAVLFEMLAGERALSATRDQFESLNDAQHARYTFPPRVGRAARELVLHLLHPAARKRWSSAQVRGSSWMQGFEWGKMTARLYAAPNAARAAHPAHTYRDASLPRPEDVPGLRVARLPVELAHDNRPFATYTGR